MFDKLSKDCLFSIMIFLPPEDVINIFLLNKRLSCYSNGNPTLWKRLHKKYYSPVPRLEVLTSFEKNTGLQLKNYEEVPNEDNYSILWRKSFLYNIKNTRSILVGDCIRIGYIKGFLRRVDQIVIGSDQLYSSSSSGNPEMFDEILLRYEMNNPNISISSLSNSLVSCIKNAYRTKYPFLAFHILNVYKQKVYSKINKENGDNSEMVIIAASIKDKQILVDFVNQYGKQSVKDNQFGVISCLAASSENEEGVTECLEYVIEECGCEIDSYSMTLASTFANKKFVELIFSKYKNKISEEKPEERYNALKSAFLSKQLSICELFLNNNYSLFSDDKYLTNVYYNKSLTMGWTDCSQFLEKRCDFLQKDLNNQNNESLCSIF